MPWQVTTQPSEEPVTLTEMKLHLRVDHTEEDALITSLITAARQWCEDFQNRSYVTQTITWKLNGLSDELLVPRPRLQSIVSVKYIDADGNEQTLDSNCYDVDTYSEPGRITRAYGQSWPSVRGDVNGVEVVFTAGFGDGRDVPDRIKAAIKLLVGHLYENREQSAAIRMVEIPMGVKSLLSVDRMSLV